jgi:hypothetical protein
MGASRSWQKLQKPLEFTKSCTEHLLFGHSLSIGPIRDNGKARFRESNPNSPQGFGFHALKDIVVTSRKGEPKLLLLPPLVPKPLAPIGYFGVELFGRFSSKLTFGSRLNVASLKFSSSVTNRPITNVLLSHPK